jgi:hypothetical protein
MRLFRKAGGNNPVKGKKTKQEQENQYEYVRKEYGFDYVPPSQYVPSRSMSEDEDDEIADEETIEVQYQGAAPVKIIQPRSEISGSIGEEEFDEDDLSPLKPLKPPKSYGRARDGRKTRQTPTQPEYRKEKKTYRTKNTPSPVPIIPEELEDQIPDYQDEDNYHSRDYRPHDQEPRWHKQQIYRSDDRGAGRRPPKYSDHGAREMAEDEEHPLGRRDRHRSEPRPARKVYRDDVEEDVVPRRRSFHHENSRYDLDGLDIGRVHTAYSYSSDDSAESYIEERSRGSRYTAKERKKKANRSSSKKKAIRDDRILENDLMDQVVIRSGTWRKTRKGWELDEEKEDDAVYTDRDGFVSRRIEEYEKPRYDRKKVIAPRKETRQDVSDDYRRRTYDRDYRRMDPPRQSKSRRYRNTVGIEETRVVPDKFREEELAFDQDWDSKDQYSRRRKQPHVEASYYATPSGRVASDYELSEPIESPRLGQHKNARGFLGRIRESVRGPVRNEKRRIVVEREVREQPREIHRRKSGALFEQVPPSMQSDVSHEFRRSRDFHHKEPDVPSTMPRKGPLSYPTRNSYEHDVRGETDYQFRRGPSYRKEREAPPKLPRRVEEDEYMEIPVVRERSPSPAVLFESTRNDTPALRANPDRRRTTSRHHSRVVQDHYTSLPMMNDKGRHSNSNLPEHTRYAPLTSPKLVRQHPHLDGSVQPQKGKGLRLGCY